MKKILICLAALLVTRVANAQDVLPAKSFWDDPINHPMMPLYAVSTMVFIVIILVMVVSLYMLRIINVLASQAEKEKASLEGKVYTPKPSLWSQLIQKLNASVPVSQEKDIELDHSYDGIRELDNHLPPWWKWLFYGTIGWAAVYLIVFHLSGSLPLSIEEYDIEVAAAKEQVEKLKASQPATAIDENTLVYAADPEILKNGKGVFANSNCGACHRVDGGGNTIGPNLTDQYWIHGGGIKNVYSTIKNGAIEKGMPAWGKSMKPQDVRDVAFYVMSLQGTNPSNAKAPQGELYKAAENIVTSDSTKATASLLYK